MTSLNVRYVVRLVALILLLTTASMIVALGWAFYDYYYFPSKWRVDREVIWAFANSIGIGLVGGGLLYLTGFRASKFLGKREALLFVSLSWVGAAALAALPFWFWANSHPLLPQQDASFLSFVNCYFEAMSGLTTTGATTLSQIESIPRELLFWRAYTHWLGGLGIIVIFVAVLPVVGGGTKRLFQLEATGISHQGAAANIRETARVLLIIYIALTAAEILALKFLTSEMTWFTAITHTFATLATGGYSTLNASVGGLSPSAQWIIIVFMVLAGVNFGLYQQLSYGKIRQVFEDSELRCYLLILLGAFVLILFSIKNTSYPDMSGNLVTAQSGRSIRDAAFQTVSIQTTTGFSTANFDSWGLVPKAILIVLMFIGGCGGSTGGGIKVIRILSALKIMWLELERAFRPSVVRPIQISKHLVEFHQRISVLAYVLGIFILSIIGTVVLMLTENSNNIDGATALTASIATLNNIGPGLALVGATGNYAWFSDLGKMFLCLLMAIGRLEVFAVLVIFMPRFWKTS